MSLALPFVMNSSRNLFQAALNPSTCDKSSAPTGSPKLERYFPEDPFSGGILMAAFDGKGCSIGRIPIFKLN